MIEFLPRVRLLAIVVATIACYAGTSLPITEISGTWGGDDAGLIAAEKSAHVHVGCTWAIPTDPFIRAPTEASRQAARITSMHTRSTGEYFIQHFFPAE